MVQHYQQAPCLQISFTSLYEQTAFGERSHTRGEILLSGRRFRITVPDALLISDGERFWQVFHSSEQILVENLSGGSRLMIPGEMLGHLDELFSVTAVSRDADTVHFQLSSQSGDWIESAELTALNGRIRELVTTDIQENVTRITLTNERDAPGCPDSLFALGGDFSGYELIDMRESDESR